MRQVSRHENTLRRGHERDRIDLRPPRPELLDVGAALFQKGEIGRLAGRDQDRVAVQNLPVRFFELGRKTPLIIVNTQASFDLETNNVSLLSPPNSHGTPAGEPLDSLLFSFADLHRIGRHLLQRFKGD